MSADDGDDLEARCEAALAVTGTGVENASLAPLLAELLDRYRAQQQLLDRLVRISDRSQNAERERSLSYVERYQKKVRQIEKIVRISDQYQAMMREMNDRLVRASTYDHLTGLPNRRFMHERLDHEVALSEREGVGFSIALVDIDYFKRINDSFGHAVGDIALVHVASSFKAHLREYDVCSRWGGEEFLILFPGVHLADAVSLAERMRCCIPDNPNFPGNMPPITVSIGVAAYLPGETLDECIHRADICLYQAKHEGRNRVVAK